MTDAVNPVTAIDELDGIDLTTTPPADRDTLVYDAATSTWAPGAASGSSDFIVSTSGDSLVFSTDGQNVLTATPA